MNTLWQEEGFKQICSRELLMEKAADIEKTIAGSSYSSFAPSSPFFSS